MKNLSWEKSLDSYGALEKKELREYFDALKSNTEKYHPLIKNLYTYLKEFVLRRGKRLASCSSIVTYKGYKLKVDERILKVSAALELYRHCILIHNDLVDRDSWRRGGKTFHKIFEESFDDRFGEGAAIFSGDILYTLANELLQKAGFSDENTLKAIEVLVEAYKDVNESQILDLVFEYKEPNLDEWYIMASKRATSLFKATLLIGGIFGEASERDLNLLREAGKNIGFAFDIQDDLIDLFLREDYGDDVDYVDSLEVIFFM